MQNQPISCSMHKKASMQDEIQTSQNQILALSSENQEDSEIAVRDCR